MTKTQPATPNYEAAIAELEGIVVQMENGQLPLEQSLAAYQRGAALIQQCQQSLTQAEQQVRLLSSADTLIPFGEDAAE
jgi:exodeoxyribonuclease VII small subunit